MDTNHRHYQHSASLTVTQHRNRVEFDRGGGAGLGEGGHADGVAHVVREHEERGAERHEARAVQAEAVADWRQGGGWERRVGRGMGVDVGEGLCSDPGKVVRPEGRRLHPRSGSVHFHA